MDAEMGTAAGDIYRFLETHGPATISQLKRGTGHKDAVVNQAIGWLAREDKVVREAEGRAVRWSLGRA